MTARIAPLAANFLMFDSNKYVIRYTYPMSTHPVATPTVRRCFSFPPSLDLWLIQFCAANGVQRSYFVRQAIKDALRKHDPNGRPSAHMDAILASRWSQLDNDGNHGLEFRETGHYKTSKRPRSHPIDRRIAEFV